MSDAKALHIGDDSFDKTMEEAGDKPVLVDFFAEWCGPCQMVAPTIDKLAGEFAEKAVVAKVDVDQNQGLAQKFGVMSIPTVIVFKNGEIAKNQAGKEIKQVGALNEAGYKTMIEDAM